jgi:IclR family transcriptional regulator, pca regulon regulatory protein
MNPMDADRFEGDRNFVMSFARGLTVIEAFAGTTRPMTIAEVSKRAGLPRAATRRLLHTLVELQYAVFEEPHYALTAKALQLGHAFSSSNLIARQAQPIISQLAVRLGAFCSLSKLNGDETMLVSIAGPTHIGTHRHLFPGAGSQAPLYASSSGLLFLSYFTDPQLRAYFARVARHPYTVRTPIVIEQINAEIQKVKQQGYALVDRTFSPELVAIAVPVKDGNKIPELAIVAITRPELIAKLSQREAILQALKETAFRLGTSPISH